MEGVFLLLTQLGEETYQKIPQLRELFLCWNGAGVFTGQEPHTSEKHRNDFYRFRLHRVAVSFK